MGQSRCRGRKTDLKQKIVSAKSSKNSGKRRRSEPEPNPVDELAEETSKRVRTGKLSNSVINAGASAASVRPNSAPRRVTKGQPTAGVVEQDEVGQPISQEKTAASSNIKKDRRRKLEAVSDTMPLSARSSGLSFRVGAHVSGAKGVQNAVTNAMHIGANSFAMFLKSQRKWQNPSLQAEHCEMFKNNCRTFGYDAGHCALPHGSYLVNLAQEAPEKAQQGFESFLDDLQRCEALGIGLYNFHPGSTNGKSRTSAIERIAQALNRAHTATKTVVTVLETMAGSGNVVGSSFEDLRDIISLVSDQSRVGVCIDTAHIFAAGYDIRSPLAFQATLERFDNIIGLKFLKALHLNDSKAPLRSNRDLHQNIGLGFLGLRAFHNIMNHAPLGQLPMVLETPIDKKDEKGKAFEDKSVWAQEIKLLESLIGMDPSSDRFISLESELAAEGAAERQKFEEAYRRKQAREKKNGRC